MRISAIQVYRVAMPLIYPFRTAFGNDDCIESVLVRMESDEGFGWGEASPWRAPNYSAEWAAGAFVLVRDWLAPALVGQEVASGDQLQALLRSVKGNPFAKAALDLAWWDMQARSRGIPLWKLLGGGGPCVQVGADIGVMETIGALLEEIGKAEAAGYRRLKLKYRPGWEIDMLTAVRDCYPRMVIHVDCNSAYTLANLPMLRELDRFDLAMVEQPLAHDDLLDHAKLQRELVTPICLDESITHPDRARQAIELRACGWINIKPGRVGGLTNALKIHDLARQAGIPCWVGGMLESAVGQSHNIALATLPNFRYPADIFPTSRFYHEDLGDPPIALSGPSQVSALDAPGIGCEPHPERLRRLALECAAIPSAAARRTARHDQTQYGAMRRRHEF
ncbi:MAG: o-succinylbenzoate synthase [Anaerolineae bacterium]